MKASELRIGNYVNYNGNSKQIEGIVKLDIFGECVVIGDYEPTISLIQPIPLTEEWLNKLGFTKNKFYPTFGYKDYCVLHDENGFTFRNDESSDANCYYLCDIKYVHQLQNLYFALTQEELI